MLQSVILQHTNDVQDSFSPTDLKYIYKNVCKIPGFSKSPNWGGRRHYEKDTVTNQCLPIFMYRAEAKRKITLFSPHRNTKCSYDKTDSKLAHWGWHHPGKGELKNDCICPRFLNCHILFEKAVKWCILKTTQSSISYQRAKLKLKYFSFFLIRGHTDQNWPLTLPQIPPSFSHPLD